VFKSDIEDGLAI